MADTTLSIKVTADAIRAVETFARLKREGKSLQESYAQATAAVAQAARALRANPGDAKLAGEFERLKNVARQAKSEFLANQQATEGMRRALAAQGVSVRALAADYEKLRQAQAASNASSASAKATATSAAIPSAAPLVAPVAADVRKSIDDLNQSVRSGVATLGHYTAGFLALQATLFRLPGAAARASDDFIKFTAQLRLATAQSGDFVRAQEDVIRIARASKTGIGETAALYARLQSSISRLGFDQQQTADVTETVALSLRVSGASAQESASAILQLSQAFGSGVLRGEEFNAVSEASPRLMQALADAIGVPRGALRGLAEDGKLTAKILAIALPQALEQLRKESERIPLTIGGALTEFNNQFTLFVGRLNEGSGVFAGVASAVSLLANNLGVVAALATTVSVNYAAAWLRAIAAKRAAESAAHLATLKEISAEASARLAAAKALPFGAARANAVLEAGRGVVAASAAVTAAQAPVSALSRLLGVLGGAFRLLLGPIGLLVTGIGALSVAYSDNKDRVLDLGNGQATLAETVRAAWGIIKGAFASAWQVVKEVFAGIAKAGAPAFGSVFDAAKGFVNKTIGLFVGLAKGITGVFDAIRRGSFGDIASSFKREFDAAFNANYLGSLKQKISTALLVQVQANRAKAAAAQAEELFNRDASTTVDPRIAALLAQGGNNGAGKSGKAALASSAFDAELAALKSGLGNAEALLEAAFRARLKTERDYWTARGELMRQQLDLDARDLAAKIDAQNRILATRGLDAGQARAARDKLAELRVALDAIAAKRTVVEVEIAGNTARIEREIGEIKARLAREIAQATGSETPAQRAEAIRAEFADALAKMAGDAEGAALVERAIDLRVARDQLDILETRWRETLERMRQAQDNANVLRDAGVLTQAQAESRITAAAAEAKAALESLLPEIQAAMEKLFPPDEVARRMETLRAEIVKTQPIVESLGTRIAGHLQKGFADAMSSIVNGTKKVSQAFREMAASILQSISRLLAERAAQAIFKSIQVPVVANAQGGVYRSSSIAAYANRIVSAPTLFAFARGGVPRLGLMGEAGAEAIMPLKRGPDGRLGVEASGHGVVVNVINQAAGARATATERQEGGMRIVDVMIEQLQSEIAGSISRGAGPIPESLSRVYGLNRVAGAY